MPPIMPAVCIKDSQLPSSDEEGAKREPDRAKHKEMLRHQENGPLRFEGAAGVVCSTTDDRCFEPTTPSAPAKEATRHLIDGRSHPSLAKEGSLFGETINGSICIPAWTRDRLLHRIHLASPAD